ncbi:MAG: hypothetical protein JWN70_3555 [Planctomycetaceae bacterium]|nr:hypothetical protein [Planctomycetaceae bacterium]
MTFRRQWRLVACVAAVSLFMGCQSQVMTVPITGVIKLNSQPIEKGLIEFYPMGTTTGSMTGGDIEKGAYSLPAVSGLRAGGKYRVQITASRKTGKQAADLMRGSGMIDLYEQFVPAKFNRESELELTLSDPNKRKFDFDLKGEVKTMDDVKPKHDGKSKDDAKQTDEGQQVVTYRARSASECILSCWEEMHSRAFQTSVQFHFSPKK